MTQQNPAAALKTNSVPGAGMRGGLGRTLLTAFLLLSIVPLGLFGFFAATQARRNAKMELEDKLVAIVALADAQIRSWIDTQKLVLKLLADQLEQDPPRHIESEILAEYQSANPALVALLLTDENGQILSAHPSTAEGLSLPDLANHTQEWIDTNSPLIESLLDSYFRPTSPALRLTHHLNQSTSLIALLDVGGVFQAQDPPVEWLAHAGIALILRSGQVVRLHPANPEGDPDEPPTVESQAYSLESVAIEAVRTGESGAAQYTNHRGEAVMGVYQWLPELDAGLLVEQVQDSALSTSDDLAAALIVATLATVLFTALGAAAVTRRITLPIVQLTATAVQIAAGDLDQKVPATRRDEIGILARAFNVMTTKLRVLYEDLEQKVRERTQQLRAANAEIRYRAMQLAISAEVGRVVTSILDQERLLSQVVELIRDCFQAYFVALYFIDDTGRWAVFQEGTGGLGESLKASGHRVDLAQDSPVSLAANTLKPQLCVDQSLSRPERGQLTPHTHAELAVPLRIGDRTIGVLDVHSTHHDAFDGDETMVLETLSGQVAVAIENARVYEMERQAAVRLRELQKLRKRFLSNMSRELRMPLNNIIGFSRVMLKGIDGPINELQRADLGAIHESGQQLLVLINDILDIAQIEAGAMELSVREVDIGEVARSVIPTANALLEGRPIEFHFEIGPDLPPVLADPNRLRQVFIKLLSNSAKFTTAGEIKLRVRKNNGYIETTITDTGIGIPDQDRDEVFGLFRQGSQTDQTEKGGTGLGLTFCKEIVEMHGGTIWLDSEEGCGTAFNITLPVVEGDDSRIVW